MADFKINDRAFESALKRRVELVDRQTRSAMVKNEELVAKLARGHAPVKSGHLRSSIVAKPPARRGSEWFGYVHASAVYAPKIEALSPFIEPAYKEAEPLVRANYVNEWRKAGA